MHCGEAFKRLGCELKVPRTDWSAQKDGGVWLTLWRGGIDWMADPLTLDTSVEERRAGDWVRKPGNQKRRRHIEYALANCGGWVEAIIVDGDSSGEVEKATPWQPAERRGLRWRVVSHDPETGHFAASAFKPD